MKKDNISLNRNALNLALRALYNQSDIFGDNLPFIGHEHRGFLFTCMDPRLNHMIGDVFPDQFTIRHAGGFISKTGISFNVDNAIKLAMGAGLKHLIAINHTDCLAVRAAHPVSGAIVEPTITQAWNLCGCEGSAEEKAEEVTDKALRISIDNAREHGWELDVYAFKFCTKNQSLNLLNQESNTFITPKELKNMAPEKLNIPQWLVERVLLQERMVKELAKASN